MEHRIQQLQQYISENLHRPLGRVELAEEACLSPVHLDRSFKAATGLTPALYVETYKVKESLELLKENLQVQEVAFQLGFANYETFSRTFKKHCKIAPADLQDLLRRLQEEVNPDSPLLLSSSRNLQDLQGLLAESVEREAVNPEQLTELQLYILTPRLQNFRSRKAASKYQLSYEPKLARQLLKSALRPPDASLDL